MALRSPMAAGQRGLPERLVAHLRQDAPLALLDLAVVPVAYLAPLVLRFNGSVPHPYWQNFRSFVPVAACLHLLANYLFGLYGQMWRYASVQEARRVVLAGLMGGLFVIGAAIGVWRGGTPLPISVLILGAAMSFMGIGAVRFQSRLFAVKRRTA